MSTYSNHKNVQCVYSFTSSLPTKIGRQINKPARPRGSVEKSDYAQTNAVVSSLSIIIIGITDTGNTERPTHDEDCLEIDRYVHVVKMGARAFWLEIVPNTGHC